jgi:hypothetical protein
MRMSLSPQAFPPAIKVIIKASWGLIKALKGLIKAFEGLIKAPKSLNEDLNCWRAA